MTHEDKAALPPTLQTYDPLTNPLPPDPAAIERVVEALDRRHAVDAATKVVEAGLCDEEARRTGVYSNAVGLLNEVFKKALAKEQQR